MIQGRDFLRVVTLFVEHHDEAFVRTSTGRAYYAAYLECRHFCEVHLGYVRRRTAREHNAVARLLKTADPELSDQLSFLRGIRNAADYDLELSWETVSRQATQSAAVAVRIIARLDELSARTPAS